jgi:hypothetical protein
MTPNRIGKMVLMVSPTSLTESSMPPIWAKSEVDKSERNDAK